jgi:hypothetical protein
MNDNEKIIDLQYKLNYFPGKQKLASIVTKSSPEITKEEINKYYDGQITNQLTKPQASTKPTGHAIAYHVNELWQMDIFDLSRCRLFNKHYQYILACIDVFSRKAYIQPMLNKDETNVKQSLIKIFKEAKPRVILSDHEPAFLSKTITSYLDGLKIPLNVNALGDHHALGIIDNFAKRIKTILTALFLQNKNTIWINSINNIVSHYNRSPHGSLNDLSPNDATKDANKRSVLDINIDKKHDNNMVSDLAPGDKVRKNILFNDKLAKGTDPKWSEKVFTVASSHGNTIILNDKSIYKRMHLLKVDQEAINYGENPIKEAKRITKEIDQ